MLEELACLEEDHLEVEEVLPEAEVLLEEKEEIKLPNQMENLWAFYQQSLREIAQKLRASHENSPPIS